MLLAMGTLAMRHDRSQRHALDVRIKATDKPV
jgi:hypothetical protein